MNLLLINLVLSIIVLIGGTVLLIQRAKCIIWVKKMLKTKNAPPRKLTPEFEVTAIAVLLLLIGLGLTSFYLYYIAVTP